VISSRANPLIKELRALETRRGREQRGEFLVEGIQPVLQALASRAPVRLLITAPELLSSPAALEAVRRAQADGIRTASVTPRVLESIAEREQPTGLAAVVQIKPQRLPDLRVSPGAIFCALYRTANPGNLGAILRTMDAIGGAGVVLVGSSTDPYASTAVKASRGAIFSVPLVRVADLETLDAWALGQGLGVYHSSDRAERTVWQVELHTPLLLIFGNEGEGLPAQVLRSGQAVRIPMRGAVDSLNLAVAAGVLLYEALRQNSQKIHPMS
jgi:TrmH family RNA methyltransferase